LRKFPKGSSGGLSGMPPSVLLELCKCHGANLLPSITRLCNLFAQGKVPVEPRQYFFGARLIALIKRNGDLRPIAAGDLFRRLTGKILAVLTKSKAAKFFTQHHQIGVGVRDGAAGIVIAARRLARASHKGLRKGRCYFKSDFENAYNSADRVEILDGLWDHFPELYAYAWAAYSIVTFLYFGLHLILSAMGVQQGDPLGSLKFSCLLAIACLRAMAIHLERGGSPIAFEAWYIDDGNFEDRIQSLATYISILEVECAKVGLSLCRRKCEVLCHPEDAEACAAAFPDDMQINNIDSLNTMGAPCGSEEKAEAWATKVIDRASRKSRCIAALADEDPHAAYMLLRYCGGTPLVVFLCRAMGYTPALAQYDECIGKCLEHIMSTAIDNDLMARLRLPMSLGGLGIRFASDIATPAFIASTCSATHTARSLFRGGLLPADFDIQRSARADPVFAQHPKREVILTTLQSHVPEAVLLTDVAADDVDVAANVEEEQVPAAAAAAAAAAAGQPPIATPAAEEAADHHHHHHQHLSGAEEAVPAEVEGEAAEGDAAAAAATADTANTDNAAAAAPPKPATKYQRDWTRSLESARHAAISAVLEAARLTTESDSAFNLRASTAKRRKASCAKGASSYLQIPADLDVANDWDSDFWLAPDEFLALLRFRFNLPLRRDVVECPLCRKAQADIHGDHILTCMGGGYRTRTSNALRQVFADVLYGAGLTVATESKCFHTKPGFRMDVLATDQKHHRYACDVAITHAKMHDVNGYGKDVKVRKYGDAVAAERDMELVPLVVNTMGEWGTPARDFISKFARIFARSVGAHPARGANAIFGLLNATLTVGVARVLTQLTAAASSSVGATTNDTTTATGATTQAHRAVASAC
jgi:hypothetical protein